MTALCLTAMQADQSWHRKYGCIRRYLVRSPRSELLRGAPDGQYRLACFGCHCRSARGGSRPGGLRWLAARSFPDRNPADISTAYLPRFRCAQCGLKPQSSCDTHRRNCDMPWHTFDNVPSRAFRIRHRTIYRWLRTNCKWPWRARCHGPLPLPPVRRFRRSPYPG